MNVDNWAKIVAKETKSEEGVLLIALALWEADEAKHLLRRRGYGVTGTSILETVKQVIEDIPATVPVQSTTVEILPSGLGKIGDRPLWQSKAK